MKNPTSSSSSSSFTYGLTWTYDVFISFRGVDTRLGFTGNLYNALRGKEVNTFMDDHELEKGAEITQALDKAIQESRIALVIFSKNYASSTFCLEELLKILECSKEKGMLVWPVFYQVEPAEVRHQKGSYAEALARHQVWNYEKLEKWKLALQKAASLSGWHFRHDGEKYEYEFIDNIIHSISKKISSLREGDKNQIICKVDDKALQRNDTDDKFQQITEKIEAAALDEISSNKLDILSTENPQVDTFEGEKVSIKHKPPVIPDYFQCPISLELMKDPVIVSTGQTYERSCIQKWLDAGYRTCPKTEQKLSHTALTPNHALRSLIASWCDSNGVELPKNQGNYKTKKSGSNLPHCDITSVNVLLDKLANGDTEQKRVAAGELRLLSRDADNRVCIADAGAIPLLVDLLSSSDPGTQEHTITTLLNLSINDSNKGTIVNAGAIPDIVDILKSGIMEARENAAATLFSLSDLDENKVTIGAARAIPPLIKLLCEGTPRGKKDAATAIFNLSIYQGNKAKAVRAGIVPPLMRFLKDAGSGMVDEALAIMAILASQSDCRIAICLVEPIPVLIEVMRTGSRRNRENAASVLWSLSTGDPLQLKLAKQLGVEEALQELSENGTDRAKRKAGNILQLLHRTEGGDNLQNSYSYRTSVYS